MPHYKKMVGDVNKEYPGMILSEAMYVRDIDAPPAI